jgi:hypothetical protein
LATEHSRRITVDLTYVAVVKDKMVVGAELMLQETFERLMAEDKLSVYKSRGIVMLRIEEEN